MSMKKCPTCKAEFYDWPEVFAHQKEAHPPAPVVSVYPCSICKQTFDSYPALQVHSDSEHPKPPAPVHIDFFDSLNKSIFVGEWKREGYGFDNENGNWTLNADGTCTTIRDNGKHEGVWELKKGSRYGTSNSVEENWRNVELRVLTDNNKHLEYADISHFFHPENPYVANCAEVFDQSGRIPMMASPFGSPQSSATIPSFFRTEEEGKKLAEYRQLKRQTEIREAQMRGPNCRGRPYIPDSVQSLFPHVGKLQKSGFLPRSKLPSITPHIAFNAQLVPSKPGSSDELSALLGFWTAQSQGEHASIASFSLFAQRLLAIGAPLDMVTEALLCAQEEATHAQLAFDIASSLQGDLVAATTYPPHSFQVTQDVTSLLRDTVMNGCVEETLGALNAARDAAKEESDPAIRQFWSRIATDEAYHASFAWRVVKWILGQNPSLIADVFQTSLEEAIKKNASQDAEVVEMLRSVMLDGKSGSWKEDIGVDYNAVVALLVESVQ